MPAMGSRDVQTRKPFLPNALGLAQRHCNVTCGSSHGIFSVYTFYYTCYVSAVQKNLYIPKIRSNNYRCELCFLFSNILGYTTLSYKFYKSLLF